MLHAGGADVYVALAQMRLKLLWGLKLFLNIGQAVLVYTIEVR